MKELNNLKAFTIDARPARITIVSRRGAGKSSLINAILGDTKAAIGSTKSQTGAGKWYSYESDLGVIEILDTRGLGETDSPEENATADNPVDEMKVSIRDKCSEVILFISKAKEVGARLKEDINQLLEVSFVKLSETKYSRLHVHLRDS